MPLWQWLLDAVAVLAGLTLLYALALIVRRRWLTRHGGTFEMSFRARDESPGRGWILGLGRYSGDRLEWFRIFSLSPRPKRVWDRSSLAFDGRRAPEKGEQMALYPDHVVVVCQTTQGEIQLALSPGSLTGFQSWLEARPPGTDWTRG